MAMRATEMRMAELSRRSGLAVPTIKYYLREGLLPRGRKDTAANQARYDQSHVARVRMLRLLREVGDVPVDNLKALVTAIEDQAADRHAAMRAAARALSPRPPDPGPAAPIADHIVEELITWIGWDLIEPDAPDRQNLRALLEQIIATGTHEGRLDVLRDYARAADQIARFEVTDLDGDAPRDDLIAQMIVGQVVFGNLLATLRRLAEEHHSAARFAD